MDAAGSCFHYDGLKYPGSMDLYCMSITNLFEELKRQIENDGLPSKSRSVILWGHNDLLGMAVESLLNAAHGWQVIKILGNPDLRVLAREVEKVHPKIVFITRSDGMDATPVPLDLVQDFPGLKIVVVNPENNRVEVYNRREFWIKETSDLLSIIDDDTASNRKGGDAESPAQSASPSTNVD